MDDTPPFLVNPRAIDIAIEQCLMLGCDIVDEVHIARKQYLDGSIPTGFQRTAIVGVNGRLPFRGRELTVTQVSVEEDSCREVQDRGHLSGLAHRSTGHAPDRDRHRTRAHDAGRGRGGHSARRPRLPIHRPCPGRHGCQPPGRQRLRPGWPQGRDQRRAQGQPRPPLGPWRGRASGRAAPATRRAASPGFREALRHRHGARRHHDSRCRLQARSSATGDLAALRRRPRSCDRAWS